MARRVLLVATWAVAAAAATGVALGAVRFVGEQVAGLPPVLTPQAVASLAASASPPAGAVPSPSTAPGPPAGTSPPAAATPSPVPPAVEDVRTVTSRGGTLAVSCRGTVASLLYATPQAGYSSQVRDEDGGLEVRFRGGDAESRVRVVCASQVPQVDVEERD